MWKSNQNMISEKISRGVGERIEEALTLIRNGEIKVGDIVYCAKEVDDVIFLEAPSQDLIQEYFQAKEVGEDPPFTGRIKYKNVDGKIGYSPVAGISKISDGKFFGKYHFTGKNRKIISRNKEIVARQEGFRVERKECESSFLLKIYGDSQEEVDKFIKYVIKYNLQFFPFYRK